MKKLLALFLLLAFPATAAPVCTVTSFYDGYSATFHSYTLYQGYIYGLDEKFLYMTLTNGDVYGFVSVPQSVPQSITNTTNGDKFYATRIKGHYSQTLMAENCTNLLNEDGRYLLTQ